MNTSHRSRRLPDDYLQRIVDSTDFVALVSESVTLKKQGSNYSGLCPFHNESKPSFSINPDKKVFNCLGCGAGGNIFHFLEMQQGMPFIDAVADLAARAGMSKPSEMRGDANQSNNDEYNLLIDLHERALKLYQEALRLNTAALSYVKSRGITDAMINEYAIGYAPGRRFILDKMNDVSPDLLCRAGLVKKNEDDGSFYDYQNHRIIFPILSLAGKTIAFGGRAMQEGQLPKYLNSPETAIFHKTNELYGWSQAKGHIHKSKTAIVTEGYIDVVVPSGYGVKNIISAMGTATHSTTIARLMKSAEHIVFCFDGDAAGLRAAQKSMLQALPLVDPQHRVSFVFLPDKHDPDSFVRQLGADKFNELIANAEPLSKFLIRDVSSRHDLSVIEARASFAGEAMGMINQIESTMLRALMTEAVREIVGPNIPLPIPAPSIAITPDAQPTPTAITTPCAPSASSRSMFGKRKSQLPCEGAPLATIATSPDSLSTPSLSLRIIGILVNDPQAAHHFKSTWVTYDANAKPEEITCVKDIIQVVTKNPDETITSQDLIAGFDGTPGGEVIARARALRDDKVINDSSAELGAFAHFLMGRYEREIKRKILFPKTPR